MHPSLRGWDLLHFCCLFVKADCITWPWPPPSEKDKVTLQYADSLQLTSTVSQAEGVSVTTDLWPLLQFSCNGATSTHVGLWGLQPAAEVMTVSKCLCREKLVRLDGQRKVEGWKESPCGGRITFSGRHYQKWGGQSGMRAAGWWDRTKTNSISSPWLPSSAASRMMVSQ